jgi:hypothetical protein
MCIINAMLNNIFTANDSANVCGFFLDLTFCFYWILCFGMLYIGKSFNQNRQREKPITIFQIVIL